MRLVNTKYEYGLVSRCLHWLTAFAVFFLFAFGLWMTELDYYHEWYHKAPDLHRSIGLLVLTMTLLRLAWNKFAGVPSVIGEQHWQRVAAPATHKLLLALILLAVVLGYLISTADGRAVSFFGLLDVPALPWRFDNQEDIAGELHEAVAFLLIATALVHLSAALWHHFFQHDKTLLRMIGKGSVSKNE